MEFLALVSALLQVSPCCERWLQRFHVLGASNQNMTNTGLDFVFAAMM